MTKLQLSWKRFRSAPESPKGQDLPQPQLIKTTPVRHHMAQHRVPSLSSIKAAVKLPLMFWAASYDVSVHDTLYTVHGKVHILPGVKILPPQLRYL